MLTDPPKLGPNPANTSVAVAQSGLGRDARMAEAVKIRVVESGFGLLLGNQTEEIRWILSGVGVVKPLYQDKNFSHFRISAGLSDTPSRDHLMRGPSE
jgi:hypothetical protein